MKTVTLEKRNLLLKCLAVSLGIHLVGVSLFYSHPYLLQPNFKSVFTFAKTIPHDWEFEEEEFTLEQKNRMLQEAFEQILVNSPHFQQPLDLIELPHVASLAPHEENSYALEPVIEDPKMFPEEALFSVAATSAVAIGDEDEGFNVHFTSFQDAPPILSQLEVDDHPYIPDFSSLAAALAVDEGYSDYALISDVSLQSSSQLEEGVNFADLLPAPTVSLPLKVDTSALAAQLTTKDLGIDTEPLKATLFIPKAATAPLEASKVEVTALAQNLDNYAFPDFATPTEWNTDFDIKVKFLPNPDGKGYIFSVQLDPSEHIAEFGLKQNLYFILDRTNSVQKHHFGVFKRATLKALASMQKTDSFNIFIIDSKVSRFSPDNLTASLKNIRSAEEFLDKQQPGGLFAAGDVYTSIEKLLPELEDDHEMHTAILLSDGKTSLNAERHQRALKKWIDKNNGKVSLYTATSGRDNDLVALDLLSSVSGGKLVYSDTHASFARKLGKLVLDLRNPLAKNLMVTAYPHQPQSHIALFPLSTHLPALYSRQPYTFIGQIDDPCSFDLVVQGRHRDQWISIKKHVSFTEAEAGDHSLTSLWDETNANISYAKFLTEGKKNHLKDAKDVLKKTRAQVAFQ